MPDPEPGRGRGPGAGVRLRRVPHRPACRRRRAARSEAAGHSRPRDRRTDRRRRSRRRSPARSACGSACRGSAHTCGVCAYCARDQENLCDRPLFTGYTRDGGYATHVVADARFVFRAAAGRRRCRDRAVAVRRTDRLALAADGGRRQEARPLRVRRRRSHHRAGRPLAGPRRLRVHPAGRCRRRRTSRATLGAVLGRRLRRSARPSRSTARSSSRRSARWCRRRCKPCAKAAAWSAPASTCRDIPSFPYRLLWEERQLVSVANLTRQDGKEFFDIADQAGIVTETVRYPLAQANEALERPSLRPPSGRGRAGPLSGAGKSAV